MFFADARSQLNEMNVSQPMIRRGLIFAAVLSGASIPISTAGQNLGAALLAGLLVSNTNNWGAIKKACFQPFSIIGLTLGLLLALGSLWTSADFLSAWSFFWKMRAYYFIPIFLVIFSHPKFRNLTLSSFCIFSLITVIISVTSASFNYPVFKGLHGDWFVFKTHTYHNFYAALAVVVLTAIVLTQPLVGYLKAILLALIALTSFDILFLVTGRTGQIVFLCMLALVILMWNFRRGLALLAFLALALTLLLPRYSTSFEEGVSNAKSDLLAYSSGNANTPIGLRLAWHKNSVALIMESPLFGHGTGSFKTEYTKVPATETNALLSENPHNDYLWLSVELGLPGGMLLLALLLAAAWQGRTLLPPWKWTLYALLLGMGVSTLANSFFTDNTTGLAFVVLSCALLNGPRRRQNEP